MSQQGSEPKISFLSQNFIEHPVNGQTLKFYPISVGMAFKLKCIGKPLASALTALFANTSNDIGTIDRQFGGVDSGREVIIESAKPEVIKLRNEIKTHAINDLIVTLTDDATLAVIGEIVMNSLKEVFPRGDASNPPVKEFIENQMSVDMLPDMLIGVAKANKGVFGPLAQMLKTSTGDVVDKGAEFLRNKMGTVASENSVA